MAYGDVAPMLADETFRGRVMACVLEQAALKDPSTDRLASYSMIQPKAAADQFCFYFAADQSVVAFYAGGGQANVTDGAILAKVQAEWDHVTQVMLGIVPAAAE